MEQVQESNESCRIETVIITDISTTCRTCLKSTTNLMPLYETCIDKILLIDLLKSCLSLKVERNDQLPQNICDKCVEFLVQLHNFKQESQANEDILHLFLESNEEECVRNEPDAETTSKADSDNEDGNTLKGCELIKMEANYCDESNDGSALSDKVVVTETNHEKAATQEAKQKVKMSICDVCGKCLLGSAGLKLHMQMHNGQKPFQCELCFKWFTLEGNLTRHMRGHNGDKRFLCSICGKAFIRSTALTKHMAIHVNFPKDKRKARSAPVANDSICPYQCEICYKKFRTTDGLKAHTERHNQPKLECTICHARLTSKGSLTQHMRVHTGETPYKCGYCSKSFRNNSSYVVHMRWHQGIKPYKCGECSQTFRQHSHLKMHVRARHTGEKPYSCCYCDKHFTQPGNLKVHIRTHTGETPYRCDLCGLGFIDSHGLKRHRCKVGIRYHQKNSV